MDDNCDRDFNDLRAIPDPTSVEELVALSTWVGEATVGPMTEERFQVEGTEGQGRSTVTTYVQFEPADTWLRAASALDAPLETSVSEYLSAGDLESEYGDHRLELLEEGATVVLFLQQDGERVMWVDPSPVVVADGTARLGDCGLRIAELAGAEDIAALDGVAIDELRDQVLAAGG